jgi:hypothetical protein
MKKANKVTPKSVKEPSRNTFQNYGEYYHLTNKLSTYHRKLLSKEMSKSDQDHLRNDFIKGGWKSLFDRNTCDEVLDGIKKETGVDLISLRLKVLNDKPQLVHKSLWNYATDCFAQLEFEWETIAYIFDGLKVVNFDEDYVKVSRYVPVQ